MPGFDYSRFDKLDVEDSEDEEKDKDTEKAEIVQDLPPELSPDLSLVLAARLGQVNVVQALIENRANVDAADPHGATALLQAVHGGINNRPVIELLSRHGAAVDARSDAGETPLGVAAASGPMELCQSLIEAGSPSREACGVALVAAASAGNQVTTRCLLDARASVTERDADGRTAFHGWAKCADTTQLKILLDARADMDAVDQKGCTPLMFAVQSGSSATVKWLCEHGAAMDVVDRDQACALVAAIELSGEARAVEIVGVLLEHRAALEATAPRAISPLVAAACHSRLPIAKLLVEAGASTDAADGVGRRPLPCAVSVGCQELCRLLLESGAGVNNRGSSGAKPQQEGGTPDTGVTALSIAAANDDTYLGGMLLQAGADASVADERDLTPLMTAACKGFLAFCSLLLEARVDPDAKESVTGKTALILAAGAGFEKVCEALLASGASANASATTGATALHAAAANGHEAVSLRLLALGADAGTLGPGKQTAASLAKASGHAALSDALLAAAAAGVPAEVTVAAPETATS